MKKRMVLCMLGLTLSISIFAGCSSKANNTADTETSTETTHEHNYTETITAEATCETDGEVTYTCDGCGDTYTEVIKATGHSFANYVSNNDATYTADGTETAKCDNCDATDTRTAGGSKLAYTFTDMDAVKYAKSAVNVRNMPTTDGEKFGGLSINDEVKVTGQCNETGWYRIEYEGNAAYVSDSYLADNKVETQMAAGTQSSSSATSSQSSDSTANTQSSADTSQTASEEFPYQLLTRYVTPDGKLSYYYCTEDCTWKTHGWHQIRYTCNNYNNATFGHEDVPGLSYETTMANFTTCDDMDGYIQAAEANGLDARGSVETPWKTADGKKILAFCP